MSPERNLTYQWAELPHVLKVAVADKIGFFYYKEEQDVALFQYAKAQSLLCKLWMQIQLHNESTKPWAEGYLDELKRQIAYFVSNHDEEGDYTGIDSDGGSFWQSNAKETLQVVANKIEKGLYES